VFEYTPLYYWQYSPHINKKKTFSSVGQRMLQLTKRVCSIQQELESHSTVQESDFTYHMTTDQSKER